jgi:hypothetical protein
VRGNVEVKEDADTLAFETTIGGNYKCDRCFSESVFESTIGGSVQIVGAHEANRVVHSVIRGNVEVVASSADFFVSDIFENEIGGSVKFEKNAGPRVLVEENAIAGELQILENVIREGLNLDENIVGGNMQVQVRQNLQCKENEPPPTGGGNTARKKQGQCRFL